MSNKKSNGLNRRRLLKSSAAAGMLAFGTTNVAAKQKAKLTKAEEDALLNDFRSAAAVDKFVHQHNDLLEELAADGVIESAEIGDLYELSEPTNGIGETVTAYQHGDRFTSRIKVFRRTDAGYLSLSIFPEENTAHAVFNPVVGSQVQGEDGLITYGSMPEPDPEGCWLSYECQDCNCYNICCSEDASGDCIQYCNQCDCTCVCCDCGTFCSSYC